MGSSSRHSSADSPFAPEDYARSLTLAPLPAPRYTASVRWPRVSRVVHSLFRVSPPPERPEWAEPRPVADIRLCPPVGEPVAPPPLLALLRENRVPDKQGRS